MADLRSPERKEFEEASVLSGGTADQAKDLCTSLETERGVKTYEAFYVYFQDYNLKEYFDLQRQWEKKAEMYVILKQAWEAYRDRVTLEKEKRRSC